MSFNDIKKLGAYIKMGKEIHDDINQRNDHTKIFETGPDHQTNFFLKDGSVYGSGARSGLCGHKKDHKRVYLCQDCHNQGKHKM